MRLARRLKPFGPLCLTMVLFGFSSFSRADSTNSFREILEESGISLDALAQLDDWPDYQAPDWQTASAVLRRLKQFRDLPAKKIGAELPHSELKTGNLYCLSGNITAVEKLQLPTNIAELLQCKYLYRYELLATSDSAQTSHTVLSTHMPTSWLTRQSLSEPVSVNGALLAVTSDSQSLLLIADHIAWYPVKDAPLGQILLANNGMDVSLLDEVVHRQAFVKASASREGEAFYAALLALQKADPQQVLQLARESITQAADRWLAKQPELERNHQALLEQSRNTTDQQEQTRLRTEIKATKQQRGLAATVLDHHQKGLAAVAPLFLQPEQEVGQLVLFQGTARRAVKIAADDQPDIQSYYELEVFTTDSQNLPITFCVTELPQGFPTGDEIRESVEIAGVFFKSWRYRSRELTKSKAGSDQLRQMFSPLVIGKSPTWIKPQATNRNGTWAMGGGILFLVSLLAIWAVMSRLAKHDRRARAGRVDNETIDL